MSLFTTFFSRSVERAKSEGLLEHPEDLPGDQTETILIGVLLNEVAQADGTVSEEEELRIVEILTKRGTLTSDQAKLALAAAHEARAKRYDIQGFTREIKSLPYQERILVVGLLFDIAFADQKLDEMEMATIRRIAELLWINHADFIDTKIKSRKRKA